MTTPVPALLAEVLRHALDGVAVVEGGDTPRVVYANATLAGHLRQPEEWTVGRALGDAAAAKAALVAAQPELQRNAAKGVFDKKAVARKISRLSGRIKKLSISA